MLENDTVLVVDDQSSIRMFISKILRNELNCKRVVEAPDGKKALDILKSGDEPISWIFSDWEMPVVTGDQLLQEVRENEATKDIPFIMVTSRNDRDALITAAQAGANDILIKPFPASLLIDKVKKIKAHFERRSATRYKTEEGCLADISINESDKISVGVVDISITGAKIQYQISKSPAKPFVYDPVDMIIQNDTGNIKLSGEIIRIDPDHQNPARRDFALIAIHFSNVSDMTRSLLKAYTNSAKAKDLLMK